MGTVNIRELSRKTGEVVEEVVTTGRPTLVTRHGRVVAALVPIDEEALEDFVLANAPEFVASMAEADEDLRAGRSRPAFALLDALDEEEGSEVASPAS